MLSKEYIAGFFDGEGHLGITISGKNKQCTLRLTFTNTNRSVLQMIQLHYGGVIHTNKYQPSYRSDWKPAYSLKLSPNEIKVLLNDIKDLVIVKLPQLKLAFEFLEFMKSPNRFEHTIRKIGANRVRTQETKNRELGYKFEMHKLNKTGT